MMTSNKTCIILFFSLLLRFTTCVDIITTIVGTGTGTYSGDGSAATAAGLNYPYGVRIDEAGETIYLCMYDFPH